MISDIVGILHCSNQIKFILLSYPIQNKPEAQIYVLLFLFRLAPFLSRSKSTSSSSSGSLGGDFNGEHTLALIRKSLKSCNMNKEGSRFDGTIPHVFVCFGASVRRLLNSIIHKSKKSKSFFFKGDLAKKKIYPTLWWLYRDNLLPSSTVIFGYARTQFSVDEMRERCDPYMKVKPEEMKKYDQFWTINNYVAGNYDQRRDFELLNQQIQKFENVPVANRLFYLALPPSVFETVTVHIRNTCMGTK
jgi:glucose-6-phosphate 1-dehydrogenase